jgi:hypothetical protein
MLTNDIIWTNISTIFTHKKNMENTTTTTTTSSSTTTTNEPPKKITLEDVGKLVVSIEYSKAYHENENIRKANDNFVKKVCEENNVKGIDDLICLPTNTSLMNEATKAEFQKLMDLWVQYLQS